MNKVYQLTYDDVEDKDIDDWINKWSRNKKSEMVRHAIRYYMSYHGQASYPVMTPPIEKRDPPEERRRPTLNLRGSN